MDVAAEVIGIPILRTKLLAFGVSSFYCGVSGALWAFAYLGTVEPQAFDLQRSFQILFMVIIGGLGTVMGAFLGRGLHHPVPAVPELGVPRGGARGRAGGAAEPARAGVLRRADHRVPHRRAAAVSPGSGRSARRSSGCGRFLIEVEVEASCGRTRRGWWLGAAVALALVWAGPARAEGEQFMPVPSYRVGPYAAGGTSLYGGFIDYMNLINMRDGGINGVKLIWEECETEYKPDRGVECYERLKAKGPTGAAMFHFYSTGIAYALIGKTAQDKIPLVTIAHGRTDAADGRFFPYVFPLITHYWSLNTDIIRYIGQREGGMAKLKGKKIVHLHHGSAYGKEPNVIFQKQAEKYGFEAKIIEVPAPGSEQQAQWLEIRQFKPDWVIVTGWGVMNPAMLKNAARVGFPMDHIIGNVWTGSEEDVEPVGAAAKGYISAAINPSGKDFKVIQEIERVVYAAGKGNMADKNRVGSIYYNRGVLTGIVIGRGDPGGAGQVREEAAHRRADPLGAGEPEPRPRADRGPGRDRLHPAAEGLLRRPRGRRRGEVPAVGRDEVEDHQRLDPGGQGAGAPADRGERGEVRQGEQHHPSATARRKVPSGDRRRPRLGQVAARGEQHRGGLRPRHPGAPGRVPGAGRGADRRAPGSERGGEDDHAEGGEQPARRRAGSGDEGEHPPRRGPGGSADPVGAGPAGSGPGDGGEALLRPPDGGGEPPHRGVHARGPAAGGPRGSGEGLRVLPAAAGPAAGDGRVHLGRRAADDRGGAGADGASDA